ncbi:hypothetical protein DKX38_005329 [Salix brachista]|uniref:Uncharacterized protein n=1 Tax=Salix brachista TaxID=2182728 RepID=A0A5N5MZR9_9ROSI|nr:hypothetical protein DKX38_005329 [Salix brachista]
MMNKYYYINRRRGPKLKAAIKVVMVIMGFFLVCYIVGRPLYWHLSEFLTAKIRSSTLHCHPCSCDCSSHPLLTLPDGTGCGLSLSDLMDNSITWRLLGFVAVKMLKQCQNMNLERVWNFLPYPFFSDDSGGLVLLVVDIAVLRLSNSSFTDCTKHDPEVSHEIEKSFTDMLSEELRLNEEEAQKKQQRADVALLEAKRMTSQYQKEAEKCNSGMDTCEAARERAEEVLQEQRKLSAIWEFRARERGWREGLMRSHVHQNLE